MQLITLPVGAIGTNCYIAVSKENNCIIIDPGANAQKIINEIEKIKATPKYILLTHGHYDHIGAVKKLSKYFKNLPFYIHQNDVEMLCDPEHVYGSMRSIGEDDYKFESVENTLKEGDEIAVDELKIKVVETPGHTKGGVIYLLDDIMFAGDTLFREEIGRVDLYGGDHEVMKNTLKKLVNLPGNYTVYPGHGEATSLDYERKNNFYINNPW